MTGQHLKIIFERQRADGLLYICEGGALGTVGVPARWTNLGPPSADSALSYEVLAELAAVMAALDS
jgi:hypothetical protein